MTFDEFVQYHRGRSYVHLPPMEKLYWSLREAKRWQARVGCTDDDFRSLRGRIRVEQWQRWNTALAHASQP